MPQNIRRGKGDPLPRHIHDCIDLNATIVCMGPCKFKHDSLEIPQNVAPEWAAKLKRDFVKHHMDCGEAHGA